MLELKILNELEIESIDYLFHKRLTKGVLNHTIIQGYCVCEMNKPIPLKYTKYNSQVAAIVIMESIHVCHSSNGPFSELYFRVQDVVECDMEKMMEQAMSTGTCTQVYKPYVMTTEYNPETKEKIKDNGCIGCDYFVRNSSEDGPFYICNNLSTFDMGGILSQPMTLCEYRKCNKK